VEEVTYNTKHQALTITDAAGQTTTFTYRATGELETVVTPPRGGLSEAQRTTTYQYYADNAAFGPGRLQRITGPVTGATTDFSYDGYGRLRTMTESDGYAVTTDYDTFDRPIQITFPDGTFEQRLYNRLDLSDSRDRLGRWTHFFYDAMRRPVLTRDPLGQTITQQWCNCGSLEKLIDANGNATTWERDAQSRVTKEIRANGTSTQYVYEPMTSRLWKRTDANGQTRQMTYFKDDNVDQVTYLNAQQPTPNVSFTYDPLYNRTATMVDGTGTTSYSYHAVTASPGTLGATQLKEVNSPLTNDLITYGYDELGRPLSRSVNSVAASQTYEPLGRINSVTNVLGNFTYAYVGQTTRIQSITAPNGQSTTFGYLPNTGDRRLQEIHNQKTGAVTISKFNYTYDVVGNIKTWTQQADNSPAKAFDFAYDRTDQLTSAVWRTTDPTPTILKRYGYSYDPAGNRTTEQLDDVPFKTNYNSMNRITTQEAGGALRFSGTVNEPAKVTVANKSAVVTANNTFSGTAIVSSGGNTVEVKATDYANNTRTNTYSVSVAPSSKTFSFDANGNQTSDGTRTFEWDAENRLLAINNGTLRSEFTYDGLSRHVRIVEKNSGNTTLDNRFLWCGEEICEERDSNGGTVTKRFFAQGEVQGTTNLFYAGDHLGSIRELVDTAGTVRARYEYDPYGRTTKTGDKDASFTFTGHYVHAASGLVLTLYRAYDPNIGRWLSEDPLGSGAGPNLYAYVIGDPIALMDPLGLSWKTFGWGFVKGAAMGAAIGAGTAALIVVAPAAAAAVAVVSTAALVYSAYELYQVWPCLTDDEMDEIVGGVVGGMVGGVAAARAAGGVGARTAANRTSNAARRQAMRDAGIPTSKQPKSQTKTAAGYQYIYDINGQKWAVTQQTTDRVVGHGPHWEAGRVKPEADYGVDPLGRNRVYNQGKTKVSYDQ